MKLSKILQQIRDDYKFMPLDAGIVHTYISSQAFRIIFWLRLGETVRELGLARNSQYFTN